MLTKTVKIYAIAAGMLCTIATACTRDFETVNTDPNRVGQISPGSLLNPVIYNVASFNMQRSNDITFDLMQVALPFPSASGGLHRYDVSDNIGNSTWNTYYQWLNNVREMKEAAIAAGNNNYHAVALTLNAWMYANLTDAFGDIPMSEATKADAGVLHPQFDAQKDIYAQLLKDLEAANDLYVTTQAMTFGTDILYANNVTKWKKFTNSLHMRLLLRLSRVPEINSYQRIKVMIDNAAKYPVFSSNDDAAILKLSGVTPLTSPWGRPVDFTTFRAAGKFFLDSLNIVNDPRRARFTTQARSATGSTNIGYQGIPSGYAGSENQFNYIPSNVNQALVTAPMICIIMPYSEVELIKAEVEWKLGNAAAAKTAYEKGVKASVEQWGLAMPSDYFANTHAAYNGTLGRILLQKYYALYFTDFQMWFEYRRTGLPKLPVAAGMVNNQKVPVRFRYPVSTRTFNYDNYQKAVQSMGGDDINTKVWWEKN